MARERGDISVLEGGCSRNCSEARVPAAGAAGVPAAGGGGFGAPKTSPLSAVEKLKDVRAPARCSP